MTGNTYLQINDIVKIRRNGERFWVIIKKFNKKTVDGIIDNDVIRQHNKKAGDPVRFKLSDIIAIDRGPQ